MNIVQIPEERYKELLKKERRNTMKEIENILSFWRMIGRNVKPLDNYRGISINKLIAGFEAELRRIKNER